MLHNVLFKAKHIGSIDNNIADSLSLSQAVAAIQEVSTNGKHFSRANTKTISQQDKQLQINNLLAASGTSKSGLYP